MTETATPRLPRVIRLDLSPDEAEVLCSLVVAATLFVAPAAEDLVIPIPVDELNENAAMYIITAACDDFDTAPYKSLMQKFIALNEELRHNDAG